MSPIPPTAPHALITGGTRGIGLAIAQLFARNGYRCTLISRTAPPNLSSLFASSSSQSSSSRDPFPHRHIQGDISLPTFWSTPPPTHTHLPNPDPADPNALITHLPPPSPKSRHKPKSPSSAINVLVNCAGVTQQKLHILTPVDEIQDLVATNLTSVLLGTKFLLRNKYFVRRERRERGKTSDQQGQDKSTEEEDGDGDEGTRVSTHSPCIINVASLLGLHGGYGASSYAASKAGLLGFTRALAAEYATHGVRVNALVPGYIDTDMTKNLNEVALSKKIPLQRLGSAHEIAHAALFLAQNEYAHNCVITLDGGLSTIM